MKIQYSALVSATSGKLNGSVASRNKGGAYFRNKGVVSNPNTLAQMGVRNKFGMLSQRWKTLTPSQRTAWNNAAPNFPYQDKLNQTRYLSGSSLYVKLNSGLLLINEEIKDVAPIPAVFPLFTNLQFALALDLTPAVPGVDMVIQDALIDYAYSEGADGNFLVGIEMTQGLSAGVYNADNKFRGLGTYGILPADGTGTLDISGEVQAVYQANFGIQSVGSKVFIRVFLINGFTGQRSQILSANALVGVIA